MPRSIRVRPNCISQVKLALPSNGYIRQTDLAEDLQISQSTVSSFLNGKPLDYLNFREICRALGLEWQEIADLEIGSKENSQESNKTILSSPFFRISSRTSESRFAILCGTSTN
jgi:DNA-binding Xre family transcriptional regulator